MARELSDAEIVHRSFNQEIYVKPEEVTGVALSQIGTRSMLCAFCRKEYSGKPAEWPHCHKRLPAPPDLIHIV